MEDDKKAPERCGGGQERPDLMNLPEEVEGSLRQRGGLDAVRSAVPDRQDLEEEARVLQALSEPTRIR